MRILSGALAKISGDQITSSSLRTIHQRHGDKIDKNKSVRSFRKHRMLMRGAKVRCLAEHHEFGPKFVCVMGHSSDSLFPDFGVMSSLSIMTVWLSVYAYLHLLAEPSNTSRLIDSFKFVSPVHEIDVLWLDRFDIGHLDDIEIVHIRYFFPGL